MGDDPFNNQHGPTVQRPSFKTGLTVPLLGQEKHVSSENHVHMVAPKGKDAHGCARSAMGWIQAVF